MSSPPLGYATSSRSPCLGCGRSPSHRSSLCALFLPWLYILAARLSPSHRPSLCFSLVADTRCDLSFYQGYRSSLYAFLLWTQTLSVASSESQLLAVAREGGTLFPKSLPCAAQPLALSAACSLLDIRMPSRLCAPFSIAVCLPSYVLFSL